MGTTTSPQVAVQATIDELGTPLREATFVVVDLETTGGPAEDCGITEIGAVKVRGGEVLGEFQTLLDPGAPIPPLVAVLTGITDRLVTGAPLLEAVLPAFLEFAGGAVLVAHNAPYDTGFLKAACARVGLPWPDPPVLDTARLARHVVAGDEVPNHKLGTLAAVFRSPVTPDHRALTDARATVHVLHALMERVGNLGVQSLEELTAYSSRVPPETRRKRTLASGLPHAPGVYVFLDARDRPLYVGRSVDIAARVRSYFTAAETRARMAEMVALAQTVRPIVCATPLEAAVRELRLIAEHAPPYNRRSRFPHRSGWVKLTVEAFPRLSVVRRVLPDGASYIGPFTGAGQAELAVAALHETYPLRQCGGRLPRVPPPGARACLLADLGRCGAPCVGGQGVGEYGRIAAAARSAMAGDARVVVAALLSRAGSLARAQRFEEAGVARDRLLAFLRAAGRAQRLAPLATTPELVAARRAGDGGWELVLIRHGRLAGAATTPAGRDPRPVIAALRATGEHVAPGSAAPPMPAALVEECEQVLGWLEQPGVRLVELDGEWAVPLHGAVGARSRLPPEIVVPEQLWGELPAARARPRGRSRSAR
ncbi:MAG: DEDD exonuclease domain-containing protein [Kineosporiaceae bacterium]